MSNHTEQSPRAVRNSTMAGIAVTAAFVGLWLWGWNPYTGFFFTAVLFFAGTGTNPPVTKRRPVIEELLVSSRVLLAVGAVAVMGWIAGEEAVYKTLRNPVFLLLCWLWAEVSIVERFLRSRRLA